MKLNHLLFVAASVAALSAGAAELIRNPKFEQPGSDGVPAGWKLRDTRVKPNLPPRDTNRPAVSAKEGVLTLDPDSGRSEVMLIQFELPLKRGREYAIDFEVKGDGNTAYRGIAYWQTADNAGKRTWKNTPGNWNPTSAEWRKVVIPFTLPSDSSSPYFYMSATGNGKAEFRNFQLRENALTLSCDSDLKVFEPGETVKFRPELKRNPENTVNYRLSDYLGHEIAKGRVTGEEVIQLRTLPLGYFLLTAEEVTPAGKTIAAVTTGFAVIPEVSASLRENAGNQFGVMVNPHTFYPFEQKERDVRFASRIGAKYVRTHRLSWQRVQSGPDAPFDWREADAEIALYRKYGMRAVATIGWPVPIWASDATDPKLPSRQNYFPQEKYIPQMKKFYRELAARYPDDIAYFEVGNEVDANNFWLGRYENARKGDDRAVFRDYIEFYTDVASSVLAGNPNAKIGPGTTGGMPAGHTYKPWMETFWSSPEAMKYTNIFCPHYKVDIPKIREVMKKHGKVVPVVLTEIGGLVKTADYEVTPDRQRQLIKRTYAQFVPQLNAGGLALCKFLLRQIPEVREGWISEMLSADYGIRPEYPAFATLIRMTAEGTFERELNLTKNASSGWVEAYLVKNGGRDINIVMLNDTDQARIHLESPEKQLEIMDEMGNSRTVPVSGGRIELDMREDSPLFVIGKVTENPGPVEHPEPQLVEKRTLTLANPGFELVSADRIDGWRKMTDEKNGSDGSLPFTVSSDNTQKTEGTRSVKMAADTQTRWYGILTVLPWSEIPKLKAGEFLLLTITYDQKIEHVEGTGVGITLGWRQNDMKRVAWSDGNWTRGTHDWTAKSITFRVEDGLPRNAEKATLEFYLGVATGSVWIDNVKVEIELYRKSNASSAYIN